MKVILEREIASLGKKGEVVEVAEGYARNYLLPRRLAVEASAGALAKLDEKRKAQEKREAQALAEARSLAERLAREAITVRAKAGGNGKLFGAVTNADVAEVIEKAFDIHIDKHKIEIKTAIKALGSYPVEIKLHKNVVAKTTVNVIAA
jgi:large subunit ribosomal protein L9